MSEDDNIQMPGKYMPYSEINHFQDIVYNLNLIEKEFIRIQYGFSSNATENIDERELPSRNIFNRLKETITFSQKSRRIKKRKKKSFAKMELSQLAAIYNELRNTYEKAKELNLSSLEMDYIKKRVFYIKKQIEALKKEIELAKTTKTSHTITLKTKGHGDGGGTVSPPPNPNMPPIDVNVNIEGGGGNFPNQAELVKRIFEELDAIRKGPQTEYENDKEHLMGAGYVKFRGPCKEHYVAPLDRLDYVINKLIPSVSDYDEDTGRQGQRQALFNEAKSIWDELTEGQKSAKTIEEAIHYAASPMNWGSFRGDSSKEWLWRKWYDKRNDTGLRKLFEPITTAVQSDRRFREEREKKYDKIHESEQELKYLKKIENENNLSNEEKNKIDNRKRELESEIKKMKNYKNTRSWHLKKRSKIRKELDEKRFEKEYEDKKEIREIQINELEKRKRELESEIENENDEGQKKAKIAELVQIESKLNELENEKIPEKDEYIKNRKKEEKKENRRKRVAAHRETGTRVLSLARGHDTVKPAILGALITGIAGIILGAMFGSPILVIAFLALAMSMIFPDAEQVSTVDASGKQITIWKGRSSATIKAFTQMTALLFGLYFLYTSNFPLSAFLMLVLAFGGYGSFPVTFDKERTDEFIKSFVRMFLGVVVISIWLFGNMFQSKVLMWMGILFLAVPPLRRSEKSDAVRAGSEDMFYRMIFLIGMGWIFYGVAGGGGWGLTGAALYTFYLIWGMSFVSGLFSAMEDVPKIGSILLIVALILFGTTGTGQENIGMAMFGQWWPTVHNSITNTLQPLADTFQGFGNTFGAGWMMFTNPMGYAQQIMDGNYAKNPTGVTGAYGLEIRSLVVDPIYPNEPFTIRYELDNMGPKDASAVNMTITSSIGGFDLKMEGDDNKENKRNDMVNNGVDEKHFELSNIVWKSIGAVASLGLYNPVGKEKLESHEEIATRNYWTFLSDQRKVERSDINPVFIVGKIDCTSARNALWRSYTMPSAVVGLADNAVIDTAELVTPGKQDVGKYMKQKTRLGDGNPDALKYIIFRVIEQYRYSTDSALQIKFISPEKWKELSIDNKFVRSNVPSTMTSGPVKLNLGSMDQPIPAGNPFFIGFNVSSPKPRTNITEVSVSVEFPFEVNTGNLDCTKPYSRITNPDPGGDAWTVVWELGDGPSYSVFCDFSTSAIKMDGPEKTFTLQAHSSYTVTTWENYDTQTAFKDTCFRKGLVQTKESIALLGNIQIDKPVLDLSEKSISASMVIPFDSSTSITKYTIDGKVVRELVDSIPLKWKDLNFENKETLSGFSVINIETNAHSPNNHIGIDVGYEFTPKAGSDGSFKITDQETPDIYIKEIRIGEQANKETTKVEGLGIITASFDENAATKVEDGKTNIKAVISLTNINNLDTVSCVSPIKCERVNDDFTIDWGDKKVIPQGTFTGSAKATIIDKENNKYKLTVSYTIKSSDNPPRIIDKIINVVDVKKIEDYTVNIIPDAEKTKLRFSGKDEENVMYEIQAGFIDNEYDKLGIEMKAAEVKYCISNEKSCEPDKIIDGFTGSGPTFAGNPKFVVSIFKHTFQEDISAYYLTIKGKYENQKTKEKNLNFEGKFKINIDYEESTKSTIKPFDPS